MKFFEYFEYIMTTVIKLMSYQFNFDGIKFSLLSVFIGISLLSLVFWAIGKLFD